MPRHKNFEHKDPLNSLGLAPMEGVSDLATRLWFCLVAPPPFMSTPFWRVSDTQLNPTQNLLFAPELIKIKKLVPYQLVPQIMAESPDAFLRGATIILKETETIDFNCGCPSPTVTGKGAGSRLLAQVGAFHHFIRSLCSSLEKHQLSVKMRTGYEKEPNQFHDLLQGIGDLPLARLTIHGRTRVQRYTGSARWDLIAQATELTTIPVFGSGDILDRLTYREKRDHAPALAGAIIGRGALRNPWIFLEITRSNPIVVSFSLLIRALACFGLLRTLYWQNPIKLFALAEDGLFLQPCADDPEKWRDALRLLSVSVFSKELEAHEIHFDRKILSQIKMLWNYLRSSLPAPFFSPLPLRCSHFEDFIAALGTLDQQSQDVGLRSSKGYPLVYNPDYDWVYAGESNPHK